MTSGEANAASTPVVSVVMIFFDPGPFFASAVQSVLDQSFDELELLLVDDGCRDGSDIAARLWVHRDRRVRLLQHPGGMNRGMAASRQLGVSQAHGAWVGFLDSDDVWEPDHVCVQLAALHAQPEARIVVSPTLLWHSWRESERVDHVVELPFATGTLLPVGALLECATFAGPVIPTCGLLFAREIGAVGHLFDPDFRGLFEDQALVARLTVAAPATAVDRPTSRYRQHARSAVQRAPGYGSRDPATLRYLDWVEPFLRQHEEMTAARSARLQAKRTQFTPRWRFWVWYGARWTARRMPAGVHRWQRSVRAVRPGA